MNSNNYSASAAAAKAGYQRLTSLDYWKYRAIAAAVIAAIAGYNSVDAILLECAAGNGGGRFASR